MAIASVTVAVTGCGVSTPPAEQASVPDLGGYTTIATMDNGAKLVNWYKDADAVCVENTANASGKVAYGNWAAWSCSSVEAAPKRFQDLVTKWKLGVPSFGEQREWPPQK